MMQSSVSCLLLSVVRFDRKLCKDGISQMKSAFLFICAEFIATVFADMPSEWIQVEIVTLVFYASGFFSSFPAELRHRMLINVLQYEVNSNTAAILQISCQRFHNGLSLRIWYKKTKERR